MKKPLNHISLQLMYPASVMEAGHDSDVYVANQPRGPDVRILTRRRSILIFKTQVNLNTGYGL